MGEKKIKAKLLRGVTIYEEITSLWNKGVVLGTTMTILRLLLIQKAYLKDKTYTNQLDKNNHVQNDQTLQRDAKQR